MSMRMENAGKLDPLGIIKRITLHWTAGDYNTTYDHYHFCIKGDGTVVQTRSLTSIGSHTWKRNTGNIGIALCAMGSEKYPPTKKQIEVMAKLVAELVAFFGLDWEDVKDHAYYAKLDGYSNLRWDIGANGNKHNYFPTILTKAKWYFIKIMNSKTYEYISKFF